MVDIKECSLCTFEQDLFAPLHRAMKVHNRVRYEGTQFFSSGQVGFVDLSKTDRPGAERLKDSVVLNYLCLQFFREHNRLYLVGHAQARARCFIAISRADPTLRRSDATATQLALLVQYAVIRQDQVGAIADEQVLVDFDS